MLKTIIPTELLLIEDLGMRYATKNSKEKRRYGLYKCFCGKEFESVTPNIKNGHTKSCGCHQIHKTQQSNTTHGLSNKYLYQIWKDMVRRCNSPKSSFYNCYGGRGISICERWVNVANFIDDMLPSWVEGLTIDRIDNDGNYEPSNCRWVSKNVQSRNTRIIYNHNTSGYRGVSFCKSRNKWKSAITLKNVTKHLGYFKTALEAAKSYDNYVIENNLEHTINRV